MLRATSLHNLNNMRNFFIFFAIVFVAGMLAFSGCDFETTTYTVTFDANGGEGSMSQQVFTEGVEQALSANKFTREGHSFYGWNTIQDSTGTAYTDKQRIKVTSDMTLYAQWIADSILHLGDTTGIAITVTFNANGGTGSMQPQTFQSGVRQELSPNAFTRAGHSFVKWTTAADGSGLFYYDEQDIVVYESMTLYAQWREDGLQGDNYLNGHVYIDLGLPSGLLWATCNIGATVPEGYGEPVAWGETASKYSYFWDNYQYSNYSYDQLTKYCNVSYYGNNGYVDNLTTLESVDDAATSRWGAGWRTPTRIEMDELFDNCTRVAVTQNGVAGYKFTGPNGNSIFLPANGYRHLETVVESNTCYYWTSSLYTANEPYMAYSLIVGPENSYVNASYRYRGLLVRAVCSPIN